jgi:hypothetical protein
VGDNWLHRSVERRVGEVCESWLHIAVCRQRPELWVTVGYMKLCVDS